MGKGGGGNFKNKRHVKGSNRAEGKEQRKQKAEQWRQTRGDDRSGDRGATWKETELDNARFQAFYKAQRFVAEGEEWKEFMTSLRAPLPACFRIYSDYAFADELSRELIAFCGEKIEIDAKLSIRAVEQLAWYPNGCAYKLGTDKRNIRKVPRLAALHQWLVKHTESGVITRQEAVSMVPPLALDVSPHHKCLDMCAAPGSKTSQLLEVINRSQHSRPQEQGLVVANDPDIDRAYMLVHQCRRINSPLLLITTHKGEWFPRVKNYTQDDHSSYFDRVLCDVPCSGDGTLRKNPMIWQKWSTSSAYVLHPLQLQIARRGLQVLKPGGLMVYSTCSMSPYEDEAVVAELLRQGAGTLELVDAREFLPLLKTRPGLSDWVVMDDHKAARKDRSRAGGMQRSAQPVTPAPAASESSELSESVPAAADGAAAVEMAEEAPTATSASTSHADPLVQACIELGIEVYDEFKSVPSSLTYIRESCFPPTAEEKAWMHLEKCLRCVPHDEDSGGFFVATLRKIDVSNSKATTSDAAPATELVAEECYAGDLKDDEDDAPAGKKQRTGADESVVTASGTSTAASGPGHNKGGMVSYEVFDKSDFAKLQEFYGISEQVSPESMYTRKDLSSHQFQKGGAGGTGKSVYYLPGPVRELMGMSDLKIVSAGMKVFERKGDDYRLLQEGIGCIGPFLTKRIVQVSCQDFCNFLEGGLVSFTTLSENVVAVLSTMEVGVVVCVYNFSMSDVLPAPSDDSVDPIEDEAEKNASQTISSTPMTPMYAICYRSKTRALNIMCGKKEVEAIRHQLASLKVLRPKIVSTMFKQKVEDAEASANKLNIEGGVEDAEADNECKDADVDVDADADMQQDNQADDEDVGEEEVAQE